MRASRSTQCTKAGILLLSLFAAPAALAGDSSWYLNAGVGYAKPSYYSSLQSAASAGSSGSTEIPMGDYLGAYYRVASPLLLGITDFAMADMYFSGSSVSQDFSVITGLLGASVEYYALGEPGSGLFVRGDAGLGVVGTETGFAFFGGGDAQSGFAFLGALGGSLKLSENVSAEGFVGYYHVSVSSGVVTAIPVDLGILVHL